MSRITIALRRFARVGTLDIGRFPRRRHRTPSETLFSTRMRRIKHKHRQQVDDSRGNNDENGDNCHIQRPIRAITKHVLGRGDDFSVGIVDYGEQTTGGAGLDFGDDGSSKHATCSGFAGHVQRDLKTILEEVESGDVDEDADGKVVQNWRERYENV
jgi:hypothetical protein